MTFDYKSCTSQLCDIQVFSTVVHHWLWRLLYIFQLCWLVAESAFITINQYIKRLFTLWYTYPFIIYSTKNIISKFSKLLCGHFRRSDKVDQNTINHCHCHGSCKLVIGLMANGFTFFLHLVFRYWQKFHSYGIRMIRRRPLSIYSLYPCPCPALRTGIWKLEIYIWFSTFIFGNAISAVFPQNTKALTMGEHGNEKLGYESQIEEFDTALVCTSVHPF